jgi:glutathione peroxidase
MNYKIILLAAGGGLILFLFLSNLLAPKTKAIPASMYDLTLKGLDRTDIPLSKYRGKKLLIVNTASKCGKTPQYEGLQELHQRFGDKVTVLGFPANNFLWQEPGSSEDIAAFCEKNYGVGFQMFEKVSVKGRDQHPLYQWLESKTGHRPDWNFAKYLVNEDASKVTFFNSDVQPLDGQIVSKF